VRFIVDAQLPPALARSLEAMGHQAEHVVEVEMRDATDHLIWKRAIETKAVIVTKDEDFVIRLTQETAVPPIVWLRIGNCSRRALMEWFNPLFPSILDCLNRGDRLVEVR